MGLAAFVKNKLTFQKEDFLFTMPLIRGLTAVILLYCVVFIILRSNHLFSFHGQ